MTRPIVAHISNQALQHNLRVVRQSAPESRIAAVIKASGYGHGTLRVAQALHDADAFALLNTEAAAQLRHAGLAHPIVMLEGMFNASEIDDYIALHLIPVLHQPEQLQWLLQAELPRPFDVWVKLNTGMNRLGIDAADWAMLAPAVIPRKPRLLMSHMACADDPGHPLNDRQLETFRAMTDGTGVARSFSATGGILLGRRYDFDLTRPGIGLYGGAPYKAARPVAKLSLPVVQVRALNPGDTVGYNATWTATKPARIATLAAGYADGLFRALSNRATLWHGDVSCPLVGRVSMDLITVDISGVKDTPEALDLLCEAQGVDALANAAGTIGYEILTSLGQRYTRQYSGGTQ